MLFGVLAQLGERQVRNLEVRGSIPLCSTKDTQPFRCVSFFARTGGEEYIAYNQLSKNDFFIFINNEDIG